MMIARHRETGLIAVEAFEYGVRLPLVRRRDFTWSISAISITDLDEFFEVLSVSDDEAFRLIETARSVSDYFVSQLPELEPRVTLQAIIDELSDRNVENKVLEAAISKSRFRDKEIAAGFQAPSSEQATGSAGLSHKITPKNLLN
jgi:hypothetical protein